VPKLVDTTIRVLSQEPLAGAMPTASLLRLAEILDGAGLAYLEVSGGGVFDAAVQRGVESPWERIRALDARTTTPLALAVRGRWLVGPRPVSDDLVRRFVASAAESGIDVFRLHDPLNDTDNLRVAAESIVAAGKEFDAGLLYGSNRPEALLEAARRLPELGAARVLLHDPAGLLQPHRASRLVEELGQASGLPVGLYVQGAGGNGLAAALEAARAGADLIACSLYPIALSMLRVSAEAATAALSGIGLDPGVRTDALWDAAHLVDEYIGDAPVAPPALRLAVRSAQRKVPVGIIAAIDAQLGARNASDRLDDVLDEVERVHREAGSPPLAAPIGQLIASQALVNVLSANRYSPIVDELRDLVSGRFGRTPGPIDPALARAVELLPATESDEEVDLGRLREEAAGLAASEEELLLLALFGSEAEQLLRSIRERSGGEEITPPGSVEPGREEQIRAVVRIVQESGIGEITVEEGGMRITVRQTSIPDLIVPPSVAADVEDVLAAPGPPASGLVRVESPMVGTFYASPQPGSPPFVQEGDAVGPGQVLCILEAMKLMNEVKAELEAVVRKVHVANAEPVEYGQLLFELEPLNGRPAGL
jgi:oxaloacetate decarboxylase (Na+ extruding) subunit alpha